MASAYETDPASNTNYLVIGASTTDVAQFAVFSLYVDPSYSSAALVMLHDLDSTQEAFESITLIINRFINTDNQEVLVSGILAVSSRVALLQTNDDVHFYFAVY